MPLGLHGSTNARRPDGSWVRGCVWAACEALERRGLFEHTRQLEQEVEETFQGERLQPPVKRGHGVFDPEALADAHAERTTGEQLGLTF